MQVDLMSISKFGSKKKIENLWLGGPHHFCPGRKERRMEVNFFIRRITTLFTAGGKKKRAV